VSSLAVGADQLFAEVVIRLGGSIISVLPFPGYGDGFGRGPDRKKFDQLIGKSIDVEHLVRSGSDEESYMAAGERVVQLSDLLVAVWNGLPAAGLGGTADVVAYARKRGTPVVHVNPADRTLTR
jgi:hypothetical protein